MFSPALIALREVTLPTDNARQVVDEKELDSLEQSIRTHGLLQSPGVEVCEKTGGWRLVWGYRRTLCLIRIFGLDTPQRLIVCEPGIDRGVLNLVENVHRSDLVPWELSEQLWTLVKQRGVSPGELSELLKMHVTTVRNLVRVREQLHPDLWSVFRRLGRSCNLSQFLELCALPRTHQVAAWNASLERGNTGQRERRGKAGAEAQARRLLATMPQSTSEFSGYWRGARDALNATIERKTWEELGHAAKARSRKVRQ